MNGTFARDLEVLLRGSQVPRVSGFEVRDWQKPRYRQLARSAGSQRVPLHRYPEVELAYGQIISMISLLSERLERLEEVLKGGFKAAQDVEKEASSVELPAIDKVDLSNEVPVMEKQKPSRRGGPTGYSPEVRAAAVAYAREHTAYKAAKKFRIGYTSITNWMEKADADGKPKG